MKNLLLPTLCAVAFAGCQKAPVADFTTDESVYYPGDVVFAINSSLEAHSYEWTLPDNTTTDTRDVAYEIPWDQPEGDIRFHLVAFSKNGKKTDQKTINVEVKLPRGNAVFWHRTGATVGPTTWVWLSDTATYNETITKLYSSEPTCDTTGVASYMDILTGSYTYLATDSLGGLWIDTVIIEKDRCTRVELIP